MVLEKRIRDLMRELGSLEWVSPQTRVSEAVKALNGKQKAGGPLSLLVVGEKKDNREILGMLSANDLLCHIQPFTGSMEELPIFWQGQFQEECQAIMERPAAEIMSPVTHVIHEGGTLMEAVHLMNSEATDWLPVVEGGEVVGILFKHDLFREILEAVQAETAHHEDPGSASHVPSGSQ